MDLLIPLWILVTCVVGVVCIALRRLSFVSCSHCSAHLSCALSFIAVLTVDTCLTSAPSGGAVSFVSYSVVGLPSLRPCLQPVALLAAISAFSFPSIPIWAGIQCSSTPQPFSLSISIILAQCLTISCPDLLPGSATDCIAAWLSVLITSLFLLSSPELLID